MAHILLVEDDEFLIDIYARVLRDQGHHVAVAHDGQQALEQARERSLDLVLMDIQMPVMDGIAATRAIRESDDLADLTIIALTNLQLPEEIDEALEAGCDGYIVKPEVPEELVEELALVFSDETPE